MRQHAPNKSNRAHGRSEPTRINKDTEQDLLGRARVHNTDVSRFLHALPTDYVLVYRADDCKDIVDLVAGGVRTCELIQRRQPHRARYGLKLRRATPRRFLRLV